MEKKNETSQKIKEAIIKYVKNIEKHLSKKTNIEKYIENYFKNYGNNCISFADRFERYVYKSGVLNDNFDTYEDACEYLKKNDPTLKNALQLFTCPAYELDSKIIASVLSGRENKIMFKLWYFADDLQKIIDEIIKENIPIEEVASWI